MVIKIEVRRVYGVDKLYPANLGAEALAKIAGTKTISNQAVELAKQLGHEIVYMAKAGHLTFTVAA